MKNGLGKSPWIIGGTALFLVLAIGFGFFLTRGNRNPATFNQTLPSDNGILRIGNAENATLKIVTAPTSDIVVDLKGPANEVGKIRLFSGSGGDSRFDLPEDWGSVTGTLTVPEGTVLEMTPSKKTNLIVQDSTGTRNSVNQKPFLVDTRYMTQIQVDKNGVGIQGNGPVGIADTPLNGPTEPGGQGTGNGPLTCGFGPQTLRDRCCARENIGTPTPPCLGNWIYGNLARACEYQCAPPADGFFGDQPQTGGQTGTPNGNTNPGGSSEPGAVPGAAPQDAPSRLCIGYPRNERSQCCENNLGNSLRIGPRPGFPDCIGHWIFSPTTLNCDFRCADYGEMLNILETLRVNAPTE
ncbi:hypothetical protein HZA44_02570 [Candidatus Peregrinibacteria bacterium]|nr:hypothetical protein [Candidatus Peregrinibacteria bacterium]